MNSASVHRGVTALAMAAGLLFVLASIGAVAGQSGVDLVNYGEVGDGSPQAGSPQTGVPTPEALPNAGSGGLADLGGTVRTLSPLGWAMLSTGVFVGMAVVLRRSGTRDES